MGWRTSWLSREVLALNLFLGLAVMQVLGPFFSMEFLSPAMVPLLFTGVVLALICQSMVYADTGRWAWRWTSTLVRFFTTTTIGALSIAFAFQNHKSSALVLVVVSAGAILQESIASVFSARGGLGLEATRVARLRGEEFSGVTMLRRLSLGLGGVVFPLLFCLGISGLLISMLCPAALLAAEVIERWLFFRTACPQRMPGVSQRQPSSHP